MGFVKRSKTFGRTFSPSLSREAYFATNVFSYAHKPQIVGLFAELLKREDITSEQLVEIAQLVEKARA